MFKTIGMFLLTALLSFSLQASPAQQERREFCSAVAEWSAQASSAKVLGMDKETFEGKLFEFAMLLLSNGVPGELVTEALMFMAEAYGNGYSVSETQAKTFKDCTTRKNV